LTGSWWLRPDYLVGNALPHIAAKYASEKNAAIGSNPIRIKAVRIGAFGIKATGIKAACI
jgi:hypothetical protein